MPAWTKDLLAPVVPDDELTIERWNAVIDALKRAKILPGPNSGLEVIGTPEGTLVRIVRPSQGFLAVAVGTIPARSTSMSQYSVNPVTLSVSSGIGTLTTQTTTVQVWPASNQPIKAGAYCWVQADADGNIFVAPLDC